MTKVAKPKRSALRRLASTAAKDFTMFRLYPADYRAAAKQPVDPRKVLFIEGKLRQMPDAFDRLWEWFQADPRFDPVYVTLDSKASALPQYIRNCRAMVRELATARYAFLCDANNVASCVPLRAETTMVQLWHACGAFKKWGMSSQDKYFGLTGGEIARHPYYRNLSLVTVSAPEVEWAYREAMMLEETPQVVQPLGVSRTDVFFDEAFLDGARAAVRQAVPGIAGRKVLLYAPTFRGKVITAQSPDDLDINLLKRELGGEYALLIKHHPYVKNPPEVPASCRDFAFTVDLPIDKLLAAADVCVSDYSSLVFEYSLFERPMAFFAPDLENYDDWRGFYYDYDELTPGPVFQDTAPLAAWVKGLSTGFDASGVRIFRQKFMSACDGHATERILGWMGII